MAPSTFAQQVVVITGASSGIGQALALRLAREGAWLALAARNAERLEALAEDCQQAGGRALPMPTDVGSEDRCRTLIQRTVAAFGGVDMLINNAGMAVGGKLEELPDLCLFKQVMEVNFYGAVYCTFYALPYLKLSRGRLVNISSLGGKLAIPFNTPYCSSKFAVQGFSDSLRMELAESGVSVTVISPYWVVTEFHERMLNKHGQPRRPRGRAVYTPKMMTAEECAAITIDAARRRRREVVMGPGRLVLWLQLLVPGLVDRLTVERFLRPAVQRVARSGP